jgi:hypothetical protein
MKRIAFLLIIGGIFISSCKKTYQCTCTASTAAGGGTKVYEIPDATQQEAQAICVANEAYIQGNTQQTTCKL